jgi:DNA-binding response OmpR family regulator
MLAGLLIDEGYTVDEAPDGHRGLHLGLSRSYDLVVLDRCLPAVRASTCLPACVPAGSLTAGADPVRLSERESALLATLAGRPGQAYPRRELLALVFADAESEVVVDTYVHYLRRSWARRLFPRFVAADISSAGCERPGQDRWPSSAMVFLATTPRRRAGPAYCRTFGGVGGAGRCCDRGRADSGRPG